MSTIVEEKPKTNYGACSLLALIGSGLAGWFGFQLVAAQAAMMLGGIFGGVAGQRTTVSRVPEDFSYGLVGVSLIVIAFLVLIWAVALAGAGFAVNQGRVFSLLTILIVVFPLLYGLLKILASLDDAGVIRIMG